ADFFSQRDAFGVPTEGDDGGHLTMSISIDGRKKSIVDYGYGGRFVGMPTAVADLESEIDRVAGTPKWLRGNAETVESLKREGWDFTSADAASMLARVVAYSSLDCARDFIAAGASPNGHFHEEYSSRNEMTSLVVAAGRANSPLVELLIATGAADN